MKRRLLIELPRFVCIRCGAECDAGLRSIYARSTSEVEVLPAPPWPWRVLMVERGATASPPRDEAAEQGPGRSFVICPACYQLGNIYGQQRAIVVIEVTP